MRAVALGEELCGTATREGSVWVRDTRKLVAKEWDLSH